jgi:S1-C subfamily serine protease
MKRGKQTMRRHFPFLILIVLLAPQARIGAADPADSVVRVSCSVRYPNPIRPWTSGNPVEVFGSGVVIEGNRILTNAHLTLYATEVYVQPRRGDDRIEAQVVAIAPEVDLAVLAVKDQKFFQKRPAVVRARNLPKVQDGVAVYGFSVGGNDLSVTKGVVSRIDFLPIDGSCSSLVIQVSAPINPGNSGGPALVDGKMAGIVLSRLQQGENIGYVLANEEIDLFLEDIKRGPYKGKLTDQSGTEYQRLENKGLRKFLKLDDGLKGVLVIPPRNPEPTYVLRDLDVLTRISTHAIDNEGTVELPGDVRVSFLSLIPRLARANTVPLTVLRAGKLIEVALPVSARDSRLIPDYRGEKLSYFIHGPLVFSPAKAGALQMYSRAKPGLYAFQSPLLTRGEWDRVRFPDEQLVVVTAPMFSHRIAKGYADPIGQVVEELNGVKIRNLAHLVESIHDCKSEFLRFRFAEVGVESLVFRCDDMEKATEEVLEDNGISPSRRGSEDMLKVWKMAASSRR